MPSEQLIQLQKNQELNEVFIYKICVYTFNPHLMKTRVAVDIKSIGILSVSPRRTSSSSCYTSGTRRAQILVLQHQEAAVPAAGEDHRGPEDDDPESDQREGESNT